MQKAQPIIIVKKKAHHAHGHMILIIRMIC